MVTTRCATWLVVAVVVAAAVGAAAQGSPCDRAEQLRTQAETLKATGQISDREYNKLQAAIRQTELDCVNQESQASADPSDLLAYIATLSPEEQHEMLQEIGEQLIADGETDCNVFGGEESCKRLPSSSAFVRQCPNVPPLVDCALYDESLEESDEDPIAQIEAEIAERSDQPCPQCINNMRELWCHQTVPPCGSYHKRMEEALLPAISRVAHAEAQGVDPTLAAAAEVPAMMQDLNMMWPCRAMCEAVISSCGCGQDKTFGDLLQILKARGPSSALLAALPEGTLETLFGGVWSMPLCHLYAPAETEGFEGHCPTDLVQPDQCQWCNNDDDVPTFVEEMIAESIADAVVDLIKGPGGLLDDGLVVDPAAKKWEQTREDNHAKDMVHHKRGSGTIIGLMCALGVLCAAGGAYGYYQHRRQSQGEPMFGGNASKEAYSALANDDSGAYEAPQL